MPDSVRKPRLRCEDPLSLLPRAMTKLFSLSVGATCPFGSGGSNLSIYYATILNRQVAPASNSATPS